MFSKTKKLLWIVDNGIILGTGTVSNEKTHTKGNSLVTSLHVGYNVW
jgi:hypothetical protein